MNEIFVLNCERFVSSEKKRFIRERKKKKDFIASSTWKAGQRAANFSRRQISSIEFINFLTTYFFRPLHQRQAFRPPTFAKDPGTNDPPRTSLAIFLFLQLKEAFYETTSKDNMEEYGSRNGGWYTPEDRNTKERKKGRKEARI